MAKTAKWRQPLPFGECKGGKTLLRPQDATCIVSMNQWFRKSVVPALLHHHLFPIHDIYTSLQFTLYFATCHVISTIL